MTQDDFSTYPVAEQTGEEPAAELPEDAGAPEPDAPDGGDAAAARPRRKNWFARHKKLTVALAMSAYALSLVETMRAEAAAGQAPRVYVLSLHDRYREDGRCLAAWSTLSDIPAPHVFDDYYRTILPASGVHGAAWLTPEARDALRAAGEPSFYLGEHLWFWPRDPTRVRHPSMHLYAGPPRREFSARNVWRIAKGFLPDLPAYLWRVGRFRWAQFWANAREGRQW